MPSVTQFCFAFTPFFSAMLFVAVVCVFEFAFAICKIRLFVFPASGRRPQLKDKAAPRSHPMHILAQKFSDSLTSDSTIIIVFAVVAVARFRAKFYVAYGKAQHFC